MNYLQHREETPLHQQHEGVLVNVFCMAGV